MAVGKRGRAIRGDRGAVGRDVERALKHGKRGSAQRVDPAHARAKLRHHVDGVLEEDHDGLDVERHAQGKDATRNLFDGTERQAAKVGRAHLGEQRLNGQRDGIVVSQGDESTGRARRLLKEHDGQPKEPLSQRIEHLETLHGRVRCRHLLHGAHKAHELLDSLQVFARVLEEALDRL